MHKCRKDTIQYQSLSEENSAKIFIMLGFRESNVSNVNGRSIPDMYEDVGKISEVKIFLEDFMNKN